MQARCAFCALAVLLGAGALPEHAAAQGGDRDCGDFSSQASAQSFFLSQGGPAADPHSLDADGDGVACESLPCPCSTGGPAPPPEPPAPPPPPEPPACPDRTLKRASNGPVTVELSFIRRRVGSGRFSGYRYRDFRTCITVAGQVVYDKPTGKPCDKFCQPYDSALTGATVGFRDLDGDGVQEVVIGLFTGGANCCVITFAYSSATGEYRRSVLDAKSGFAVRDYNADGAPELLGGDFRFKYAFTCGACSIQPIRIWQFTPLGFVDATRAFPGRIRDHANGALRYYQRVRGGPLAFVRGTLNAYVADLCLLDRCGAGYRVVRRAIRRGDLSRRRDAFETGPYDQAYLQALKRFLNRTGYAG